MVAKSTSLYVCSHCDGQFPGFLGRCPECGQWGTIAQQVVRAEAARPDVPAPAVESLVAGAGTTARWSSGLPAVDEVLGGGIVPGSLILLGGDPGIGKSTLVSQLATRLNRRVLYGSGEESRDQVAARFARLGLATGALSFLAATETDSLAAAVRANTPELVVVDSVQTMRVSEVRGDAGSPTQVKAVTARLMELAKSSGCAVLLIGHVTKDGAVAGPKVLEHLVDVVLVLEGERDGQFRILRTFKNRFGGTNVVSVLEMTPQGLSVVANPSERFLAERHAGPGSAIASLLEGQRVFLLEVQALVQPTVFGMPRRTVSGLDQKRLQLLLAILTKRAYVKLATQDVFVNVVGGVRLDDRASDVAVAIAIASAVANRPVRSGLLAIGELGLGGEVRRVPGIPERLREAARLGLMDIIVPAGLPLSAPANVTLHPCRSVTDALHVAIG